MILPVIVCEGRAKTNQNMHKKLQNRLNALLNQLLLNEAMQTAKLCCPCKPLVFVHKNHAKHFKNNAKIFINAQTKSYKYCITYATLHAAAHFGNKSYILLLPCSNFVTDHRKLVSLAYKAIANPSEQCTSIQQLVDGALLICVEEVINQLKNTEKAKFHLAQKTFTNPMHLGKLQNFRRRRATLKIATSLQMSGQNFYKHTPSTKQINSFTSFFYNTIGSSNLLAKQYKRWGFYEVFKKTHYTKCKHLVVQPGKELSMQKHLKREEFLIILSGTATITVAGKTDNYTYANIVHIPRGKKHKIANKSKQNVEIFEVQVGNYLEESDIIKYSN